jgi:hypothetical protein
LNLDNPGWNSDQEVVNNLIKQAEQNPKFKQVFQQDNIFLFEQVN